MVFCAAVFTIENTDGEKVTVTGNDGKEAFIWAAADSASRSEQFASGLEFSVFWSVQFEAVPVVVSVFTVTTNFGGGCTQTCMEVPVIEPSVAVTVCAPAVAKVTVAVPTPLLNASVEKVDDASVLPRTGVPE